MHQIKLYLDTSVYGGYFDEEFRETTVSLFTEIRKGSFFILYSNLITEELNNAPANVQHMFNRLPAVHSSLIEVSDEMISLARQYIEEKVVGPTSFADCLHIAIATIANADVLVSWNFKHIVNFNRIRGYNSINLKEGYKTLEIRSPLEFSADENKG
jgi:predicted nucleic acid-binding protein